MLWYFAIGYLLIGIAQAAFLEFISDEENRHDVKTLLYVALLWPIPLGHFVWWWSVGMPDLEDEQ
jgi:hypothetical protein